MALTFCSLCLQTAYGFSLLIITLAVIFHLLPSSSAYALTSPPIDYAAVVLELSILKSPYSQQSKDEANAGEPVMIAISIRMVKNRNQVFFVSTRTSR
jgi:hypothetical protein